MTATPSPANPPRPTTRRGLVAAGIGLIAAVWAAAAADVLHHRRQALAASRADLQLVATLVARQLHSADCGAPPEDIVAPLRARGVALHLRWPRPDCNAAGPAGAAAAGADNASFEVATAPFADGRGQVEVRRLRADVLSEWRDSLANTVARNLVVSLLALALFASLGRQLRRQEVVHAQLSAAEQRWRAVFDTAPVGIVMLPPNTRYVIANPAFQRMLGYTMEELQDLTPDDITHPDDVALTREQVARLRTANEQQVTFTKRYLHRDGHVVWTALTISQLTTPGPLRGILVAVVDDLTGRREAEEARQGLEAQLRQAQKLEALGTFAGGIAHDFNNILSAILGYGERALKGVAPGTPASEDIHQVLSAGARARSLVRRILAFSRSGVQAREPVDVAAVVQETVDLLRGDLASGVALTLRCDAPRACVLGDATHLHQVVMNLCSNAVHAVGERGAVTVSVTEVFHAAPRRVTSGELRPGRHVRIEVEDTGVGMPADVQERMFDPFYTTRRAGEGTGLGLSLVDGIVKEYGGGIEVDSAPGRGSRFRIDLPLADEAAFATRVPEADAPHGRGEIVLLVDDEPALVRLGEEVLAELGYEPVGVGSGAEALARFEQDPAGFDLLLSDQTMAEMAGTELVERMRALRPGMPVVLMSGNVSPELEERAAALAVSAVLAKPLDAAALARALRRALEDGDPQREG